MKKKKMNRRTELSPMVYIYIWWDQLTNLNFKLARMSLVKFRGVCGMFFCFSYIIFCGCELLKFSQGSFGAAEILRAAFLFNVFSKSCLRRLLIDFTFVNSSC